MTRIVEAMSFQRQCDLDAHSQEGFLMKDEDELFFVHGMQDVDESWDQMTARSYALCHQTAIFYRLACSKIYYFLPRITFLVLLETHDQSVAMI